MVTEVKIWLASCGGCRHFGCILGMKCMKQASLRFGNNRPHAWPPDDSFGECSIYILFLRMILTLSSCYFKNKRQNSGSLTKLMASNDNAADIMIKGNNKHCRYSVLRSKNNSAISKAISFENRATNTQYDANSNLES
jgi:hypothetical protein